MPTQADCELCSGTGGELVHRGDKLRVVRIDDALYPGFCRVIWNDHVREMTDLPASDRALLMAAVWQVEVAMRAVMRPDKINLACLGNQVPHLHWHLIPRYAGDANFPAPVWAQAQRVPAPFDLAARAALLPLLRESIVRHMNPIA